MSPGDDSVDVWVVDVPPPSNTVASENSNLSTCSWNTCEMKSSSTPVTTNQRINISKNIPANPTGDKLEQFMEKQHELELEKIREV